MNALASVAHSYTILEDYEMVVINNGTYQVFNASGAIEKKVEKIDTKEQISELGSFSCFTEKEIFDIPEVISNVFQGRINFETKEIHNETISELLEHDIERIEIIASGTSYYA